MGSMYCRYYKGLVSQFRIAVPYQRILDIRYIILYSDGHKSY